jgi:hypothetical protein
MLGVDDPATFLRIRDTLLSQCDQVDELERREIVRVWRDWHAAYPLAPKPHRSILEGDVVDRLRAVVGSLTGRHARAAYEQQAHGDVFVLCVEDALVGWRCRCAGMPSLSDIDDASLIVTSADFAWTLGTHKMRTYWRADCDPVFVAPEMLMPPIQSKWLSLLIPKDEASRDRAAQGAADDGGKPQRVDV